MNLLKEVMYGKITYTIQIGGQCPALIYDYKEEDILGIKTR